MYSLSKTTELPGKITLSFYHSLIFIFIIFGTECQSLSILVNQSLPRVSMSIDNESIVDEILLKLLKTFNIPHTIIEIVVKLFEGYVATIQHNLLLLQTYYGSDQGVLSSREKGRDRLKSESKTRAVQSLSQVNTMYKFQNKLYKNTRFVPPELILLGSCWDRVFQME